MQSSTRGLVLGIAGYLAWGISPLYWRLLAEVPVVELLAHRGVWTGVTFSLALVVGRWAGMETGPRFPQGGAWLRLFGSSVLLTLNWLVFVYAVLTHRVVEASLGYFINPIVSVALGRVFLGERLNKSQLVAVVVAAAGVGCFAHALGGLPWISLTLAISFGVYGLIRKTVNASSLVGSTIEALLIAPFALAFLWRFVPPASDAFFGLARGAFGHDVEGSLLLMAAGPVTAVPLFFFVAAARRLRLVTIGFLQFIAPTMQLLLGVLVFGEPLDSGRMLAFVLIWTAIAIFSLRSLRWAARVHR